MNNTSRLWKVLGALLVVSFGILLYFGREIYLAAPPMPSAVKTVTGQTLFTRADIETGRQVWQSIGGHQLGSIWGHGSYVAPDWSADWLHREATGVLDTWAQRETGKRYSDLDAATQAALQAKLVPEMRGNTYNPDTGVITVSEDRAAAIAAAADHYQRLFSDDPSLDTLRAQYAIQRNPIPDAARRQAMTAFFFWSSWSTVTNRPGQSISYTSNWPSDPLVGNTPTAPTYLWTFISIFGLLAGVGALTWYYVATHGKEPAPQVPDSDPLRSLQPTPSMKATAKYFWVVTALFLVQIVLGGITAHYAVEGQGFYGFPLSDYLPYAVTRTWHLQLAVLWIATAWLATGLYIAPAISGHEPKFQRLGVNFLFTCLLIIVVGGFAGQWFAVMQKMGLGANFWFGHQGWEYVDLGRFWQAFLFIGLMLWLRARGTRALAGTQDAGRQPLDHDAGLPLDGGNRALLRRRAHVGPQHPPLDGRILALVGRAPVGRRLLRGLRDRSHRIPVHEARAGTREDGYQRRAVRDGRVPDGRRARHVPPPVLDRDADRRAGDRLSVLRTRGRTARAGRFRGL